MNVATNDAIIPFLSGFADALLNGVKTATTRTKKYCKKGDVFLALDKRYVCDDVIRTTLGDVAENYWRREGMRSKKEFIAIWNRIHYRTGYDSAQKVWLHLFHRER